MMQWPPGRSENFHMFREGSLIELHLPSWLGEAVLIDVFCQNTSRRCFLRTVFWTPWMIGRYCTSHFRQQRYCNTTCCKSVSPTLWGIRDGSQIFFHILKPKNKPITHALVPWTMAVGWLLDLWCRFLWGCHEVFLHGYSSTGDLYLEVPSKGVLVADLYLGMLDLYLGISSIQFCEIYSWSEVLKPSLQFLAELARSGIMVLWLDVRN